MIGAEIRRQHPGPADLKIAEDLSIPGEFFASVVDDPHVHAEYGTPLSRQYIPLRLIGHIGLPGHRGAYRAKRRYLGHAPRSEEHTSEIQSLIRTSYAVF